MAIARLNASVFKSIIDSVSKLADHAVFYFNTTGITMQAMDPCHVALCFMKLDKSGFVDYECNTDLNIGLSLVELSRVLKCSLKDDGLQIELADKKKMGISLLKSSRTLGFEVNSMDLDVDILQIPETSYESSILMPSALFKNIVKDISVMGESCTIDMVSGCMTLLSEKDGGVMTFKDPEKNGIIADGTSKGTFSNKYLQLFTKASSLDKSVTLKMSTDTPICVEYKIGDLGDLKFYLAPKANDEGSI
ncbi:unnamed protein product [Pylaiella littoralis]